MELAANGFPAALLLENQADLGHEQAENHQSYGQNASDNHQRTDNVFGIIQQRIDARIHDSSFIPELPGMLLSRKYLAGQGVFPIGHVF
jgi:hypothetical protein